MKGRKGRKGRKGMKGRVLHGGGKAIEGRKEGRILNEERKE